MTRKVTKVTYTSEIDSLWFQDLSAAERLLKLSMKEPIEEITEDGRPVFSGVVLSVFLISFVNQYEQLMSIFNVVDPNLKWDVILNDVFYDSLFRISIAFFLLALIGFVLILRLSIKNIQA